MHRILDISPNRSQRPTLDLSDLEHDPYSDSTTLGQDFNEVTCIGLIMYDHLHMLTFVRTCTCL